MYRIWLTVFGAGYSPLAPGTCGSAVVTVIFLAVALVFDSPILVGLIMLGVALHGGVVTVAYGDRLMAELGKSDPGLIVSDEQCGQGVTYLCYFWLAPLAGGTKEIIIFAVIGFILFRIFDILKPPPVRQLEKVKGAWGVLLDDVMAGIYANLVLQILWWTGGLRFILD